MKGKTVLLSLLLLRRTGINHSTAGPLPPFRLALVPTTSYYQLNILLFVCVSTAPYKANENYLRSSNDICPRRSAINGVVRPRVSPSPPRPPPSPQGDFLSPFDDQRVATFVFTAIVFTEFPRRPLANRIRNGYDEWWSFVIAFFCFPFPCFGRSGQTACLRER